MQCSVFCRVTASHRFYRGMNFAKAFAGFLFARKPLIFFLNKRKSIKRYAFYQAPFKPQSPLPWHENKKRQKKERVNICMCSVEELKKKWCCVRMLFFTWTLHKQRHVEKYISLCEWDQMKPNFCFYTGCLRHRDVPRERDMKKKKINRRKSNLW